MHAVTLDVNYNFFNCFKSSSGEVDWLICPVNNYFCNTLVMFSQELEKVFNEELQITILKSASMTKQVLNLTMGFNFKFDP